MWSLWRDCQGAKKMWRKRRKEGLPGQGSLVFADSLANTETSSVPGPVQGILEDADSNPSLKELTSCLGREGS